jgi:hypothetical protein
MFHIVGNFGFNKNQILLSVPSIKDKWIRNGGSFIDFVYSS